MKWVAREKARLDRIACPWLISRFIDRDPTFLFVSSSQVLAVGEREGATPHDIPGVELGHHGQHCSFDAFLDKYKLDDPALRAKGAHSLAFDPASSTVYALLPDTHRAAVYIDRD
jgi:hypothetical protein